MTKKPRPDQRRTDTSMVFECLERHGAQTLETLIQRLQRPVTNVRAALCQLRHYQAAASFKDGFWMLTPARDLCQHRPLYIKDGITRQRRRGLRRTPICLDIPCNDWRQVNQQVEALLSTCRNLVAQAARFS